MVICTMYMLWPAQLTGHFITKHVGLNLNMNEANLLFADTLEYLQNLIFRLGNLSIQTKIGL